jgi:hypothetical protein
VFFPQGVTAMTDDKTKTDFRDRDPVAGDEENELRYFAEKFGLSIEQVRELIAKHGNDRETFQREAERLGQRPG